MALIQVGGGQRQEPKRGETGFEVGASRWARGPLGRVLPPFRTVLHAPFHLVEAVLSATSTTDSLWSGWLGVLYSGVVITGAPYAPHSFKSRVLVS